VSQAIQEQRRRWAVVRFALLATTLMLSIGVLMIAAPLTQHRLPLQIAMYAPLVVGVYVVSESTRFVVIWGTALAFTVVLGIFATVRDEPMLLIVDVGIRCVLLGALMFWVAREMLREVRVSLDTILGGICLYILIGYLYSLIYVMLLLADPTSILSGGQPLDVSLHATHPLQTVPAIFYFSFTAFTTMGFGDITPVTALARFVTITEGMLGQLYPAIFIARLVSLSLIDATSPPTGG
jgi:hypothetical protein